MATAAGNATASSHHQSLPRLLQDISSSDSVTSTEPPPPPSSTSSSSSNRSKSRRTPTGSGNRKSNQISHFGRGAERSRELKKILRRRGLLLGDDEDESRRRDVLEILEKILCQWCASLQALRPSPDNNKWKRPRVALVTFGSYRLKVHRPDSDLDVLALSPPTCTRGDFFTSLVKLLEEHPGVDDMHPIPSAFTPVIKFRVNGIHVDMLFARLADSTKLLDFQEKRPSPLFSSPLPVRQGTRLEYLIDDFDLASQDEAGVRSLNGVRVTQLILETVPDPEAFRITLVAVKEWAVTHGIYSNVLGFLGGVNFAILVAWVCKRNPNHQPSELLRKFFRMFASWKWPSPVKLGPIQRDPPAGVPRLAVWDPENNPRDGRHIMPIITPAYPSMNSSYNVGIPQLRRINKELVSASILLERNGGNWKGLLDGSDFFKSHSNFLQITVRAENYEDFLKWQRLCESRLRILFSNLETPQISAWPFAKFFKRRYTPAGMIVAKNMTSNNDCMHESLFYVALRFAPGVESVNLRYCTSDFLHNVNSWEERKKGMDLNIAHILQSELPDFVCEETAPNTRDMHTPDPSETMKENMTAREKTKDLTLDTADPSPEDDEPGTTRLTPKLARSTVSDAASGLPHKRHRSGF